MRFSRFPVRSALALAVALAAAPAFAQSEYSGVVVFGDSLSDAGAFRPGLVQAYGPQAEVLGRFTTNPGQVWAEHLAEYFGHADDAVPNGQGGSNYAVGGARVAVDGSSPFGAIPSVASQVSSYLAAGGGKADPNALYTVWAGANDLFAVAGGESQDTVATAAAAQVGAIAELQQAGARYVLVPNIPNLGSTPSFTAQGAAAIAGGKQLAQGYNTLLYAGLQSAGLRVIPLDTFHFLDEIIASPAAYGLANVTDPACGALSSLLCSPADYVTADADRTYLFADGVHPTTYAHEVLAQYAESVLEGPRLIAVLPQSAATTGRARAERVALHVEGKPAGDGTRWWGGVQGNRQDQPGGHDGSGVSGLLGVEMARGGVVLGLFGGVGRTSLDFAGDAGDFDQSEATFGVFTGWYGDKAWVNGQFSYTQLSFDVTRDVHLGSAVRRHEGSPDGSNLGAALTAGYRFGEGALRHGPLLGLVSQNIVVDPYSEDNLSSTALRYLDQRVDSMVGSVGWQADYAFAPSWRGYAQVSWNREFKDAPEQVYAQLRTAPEAGEYAVPGLSVDQDYGSARLGVRTAMLGLQADIGLAGSFGRDGGNDAQLFLNLGGNF